MGEPAPHPQPAWMPACSFNQASKPGQPSAAQLDAAWDMESWKAEEEVRQSSMFSIQLLSVRFQGRHCQVTSAETQYKKSRVAPDNLQPALGGMSEHCTEWLHGRVCLVKD